MNEQIAQIIGKDFTANEDDWLKVVRFIAKKKKVKDFKYYLSEVVLGSKGAIQVAIINEDWETIYKLRDASLEERCAAFLKMME